MNRSEVNLLRHMTESRHWISPHTARESPSTVLHCWQWRVIIGWLLSASEDSFLSPGLWIKTLPSNSMLEVLQNLDPDGFPACRFSLSVGSQSKRVSSSVKFGAVGRWCARRNTAILWNNTSNAGKSGPLSYLFFPLIQIFWLLISNSDLKFRDRIFKMCDESSSVVRSERNLCLKSKVSLAAEGGAFKPDSLCHWTARNFRRLVLSSQSDARCACVLNRRDF